MFELMKDQCDEFSIDLELLNEAIYDERWDPIQQFNGCNFVQDDYHPYLPCFLHDWRWICFEYSKKWDQEFEQNLIKAGMNTIKAKVYYFAVRFGWIFYHQFKK